MKGLLGFIIIVARFSQGSFPCSILCPAGVRYYALTGNVNDGHSGQILVYVSRTNEIFFPSM